jgi:putative methionine-R-sulfoxide reductase with GAF domain
MSTKVEMTTGNTQPETNHVLDRLGALSVRWKIRIAYWAGILLTACFVIVMVSFFQRRAAIHNAYDKVYLLRSVKTKLAEAWFERLSDKIKAVAVDPQTLDIQGQLSQAFLTVENDNYSTPGAESLLKITPLLNGYYTTEVLPVLEARMDKKIPVNVLMPADNRQQIFQYLYIASNNKPMEQKYTVSRAADGSSYSTLHGQFHPGMVRLVRSAGISDMLMVDYKSGYVVYSMKKNLDFATNLYDGPYKNSGLGIAFKAALSLPAGSSQYTDESLYAPAMQKPTLFVSAPVYSGGEIKGVIVFAVEAGVIDGFLSPDKDDLSAIRGLKTFLTGQDLLYRNNDPGLADGRDHYIRRLKRFSDDGKAYNLVSGINATAMVQRVNSLAFAEGTHGKEAEAEYRTETGEQVLCSYGPLTVPGLNWLVVSQLDKAQALRPVRNLTLYLIALSLFLACLVYILVHILSDKLALRLISLKNSLYTLATGENKNGLQHVSSDEIEIAAVAAGILAKRINQASTYTDRLGQGDLDQEIDIMGEGDKLATSLNSLKNILVSRREEETARVKEDEIRNWSTHGVAMFNDILRLDNNNLEKLCLNIIRNIIAYLSANQGGIFLIDKEEDTPVLDLVAAYAFDRQKFLKKRIGLGEGLTGTCVLEKKTILLSRIPQDYMEITSGLGGAKPSCLLIVPLKKDDDVLGVIEMASFNLFKPHEVEFVEKVAESIASALITVRLHLQTSQYLERFQQQAEEKIGRAHV